MLDGIGAGLRGHQPSAASTVRTFEAGQPFIMMRNDHQDALTKLDPQLADPKSQRKPDELTPT